MEELRGFFGDLAANVSESFSSYSEQQTKRHRQLDGLATEIEELKYEEVSTGAAIRTKIMMDFVLLADFNSSLLAPLFSLFCWCGSTLRAL